MSDIQCTFTLTSQKIAPWKRCEIDIKVGDAGQVLRVFGPSWDALGVQLRVLRSLIKSAQRGCESGVYGQKEYVCGCFVLFIDPPPKLDEIRYSLRLTNDLVGTNMIRFQQPWSVMWKMLAVIRETLDDALDGVEARDRDKGQ